jgi:hypothetical protein
MDHRPRYQDCDIYCCDPPAGLVRIYCTVCGQDWPCETKRSHVTPGEARRIERWADGKLEREARLGA